MNALLLSIVLAPASGTASSSAPPPPAPTRVIDIVDDDTIEGEVLSPTGHRVDARVGKPLPTLIRLRPHFMDAMTKMSRDM